MNSRLYGTGIGLLVLFGAGCATTAPTAEIDTPAIRLTVATLLEECLEADCGFPIDPQSAVDTVVTKPDGGVEVHLNEAFAQVPFREDEVARVTQHLQEHVEPELTLTALGQPLMELVPNLMRPSGRRDASRMPASRPSPRPIIRFPEGAPSPTRGLAGRHIALWASHGWYYEPSLDRWEWQRARLFTTVEDLLPTSFVLPYLAPMLERAGAHVWMPRERDTQSNMVIVDNDQGSGYSEVCDWHQAEGGFAVGSPPYSAGDNPWSEGSYRWIAATDEGLCSIQWRAALPEPGNYAVYVSHGRQEIGTDRAKYTVHHAGGTTHFEVDQGMAPGTWVYVGTYQFDQIGEVRVSSQGKNGSVISADAVRFGGGMGNVERGGRASGRPRWVEGARYSLQFDGMPARLVYNVTEAPDKDYLDDYRNRGEWVNYLRGAPLGPNKDPNNPGLGIPVDLALAFHTDAGIARGDTTIGTLAIYSSRGYGPDGEEARVFNNGISRFANRDLADAIQTQIVSDIRVLHDSSWTRRAIWDRDYSEAYRPNVPSMLLELLSHQNFADMRFALDPVFRFDVSRAIYKAMLRFVAFQYGEPDPVVAPLAPIAMKAVQGRDGVILNWAQASDPLEPSAVADAFRVYVRRDGGGFDNGVTVVAPPYELPAEAGITSFRVTALNEGGESAPSETIAVGVGEGRRVLIVSGFDRIGPPAAVDMVDWRGFPVFLDHGVSDGSELSYVGAQHELRAAVPWADDDAPGHGASYADWETRLEPGNTFDFVASAGEGFLATGMLGSFDSVSDEAFASSAVSAGSYDLIYLLLGEERESLPGHASRPEFRVFPAEFQAAIRRAQEMGVPVLTSGSHLTEELQLGTENDRRFGREVLGAQFRAERASRTGEIKGSAAGFEGLRLHFNTRRGQSVYAAENPEAIVPLDPRAETLLRYGDSNMSAAVGVGGRIVTLGFPIETIEDRTERLELLRRAIRYLDN